jgi:hypothetical protein
VCVRACVRACVCVRVRACVCVVLCIREGPGPGCWLGNCERRESAASACSSEVSVGPRREHLLPVAAEQPELPEAAPISTSLEMGGAGRLQRRRFTGLYADPEAPSKRLGGPARRLQRL